MLALHKATDAAGFANLSKSANIASRTFRDAAASTGMFEVQQLRLNSATDDYIKKLRAQKMGFRDMLRQRKVANAAYKEQLALENMSVRRNPASSTSNKGVYDVIIPKQVSADLDTARKRMAFFNAELKSGAHQMVNWGKNTQWAGRQLMVGFTMPIAAFGAAAGVMAYQIDKELTRIQKVIDTNATDTIGIEKELRQVRVDGLKTATMAAKEYGSAATDTLNVQAELAATGLMGQELQKSTAEVMRIARLGEIDNDTAINATIALQSVFRDTIKTSQDLSDAFNYMNSVENATSLSTADFAEAIPVAASSVKAFGGDVKELGVLLTAMKENGIGASEGANALKATMQRLGRPSKQVREEWQALTNTDITKLVDNSDGLIEVFTNINKATSGLDPDAQRKAFAGLFGSYQVSKMMALTKGMGELEQGVGQVSKAFEISQGSAEDWAATAETEVERYQKSISGMWDIAFQSMKVELAEVGEPFVVLGTQIVKGISAIIKAFNDLPDGVKIMAAMGVGATALAGAVLMLAGLFANLTGNAIKVGASLAGLVLKMNLLDRQTKAGEMVTKMAATATTHQMDAVKMLTMQIEAQTAAQREANMVMSQAAGIPLVGAAGVASPALSPGAQNAMMMQQRAQYEQSIRDKYKAQGPSGKVYNRDPDSAMPWMQVSNSKVDSMVMRDMQTEALEMNEAMKRSTKESLDLDNQRIEAAKKRNQMARATGAFMAVESAALAATLISDNERVEAAAQIAMFAGLAAPAALMLAQGAKFAAVKLWDGAKAAKGVYVAAKASTAATLAGAAGATKFATALKVARTAMLAVMGPVGWTLAAIGAVGAIVYKVAQDQKRAREQAIADQKELNSLAKDYASAAGETVREYRTLHNVMLGIKNEREATQFDEDVSYFKDTSEEGGSKKIDAFNRLESDAQRAAYAQQMFIDLQVRAGMTSSRAATTIRALYSAAGEGADDANAAASLLLDKLGQIGNEDWETIFSDERAKIQGALTSNLGLGDDDVTRVAGLFSEAMANAGAGEGGDIMQEFENITQVGWQKVWEDVVSGNAIAMDAMKRNGITSMTELQDWWNTASESDKFKLFTRADGMGQIIGSEAIVEQLNNAEVLETRFVKEYAKEFGNLGGEVTHFSDLLGDINLKTKTLSFGDAEQEINNIVALSTTQGTRGAEMSDEAARLAINAFNAAHGFEEGATKTEALENWMGRVKAETNGVAGATGGIISGLLGAQGAARGLRGILAGMSKLELAKAGEETMGDIQQELADNWESALSDKHESQSDALSAQAESDSEALSNRLDRESAALDAAWDGKRKGLEAYWDARIEGIDKAIEAEEKAEEKRQKMFDAEIARINKLADMANTNIDFNVALNEGNLDEAAKIQNTALATEAQSVFERERERGADKSAKRVDRLGNKKEGMEEHKDAAMEALDKRAEAARAYFDNYRKMEEDSLAKSQKANEDSLEKRHEQEKKHLERVLKTFLASTPTTKKALQKQVEALGLALNDFGIKVLDPMSVKWGNWFSKRMSDGLANAAAEQQSREEWDKFAEDTKNRMLEGWGFKSEKEFFDFINGKQSPTAVDATPRGLGNEKMGPQTGKKTVKGDGTGGNRHSVTRHGGGPIAGGVDNRAGVAKNYKGLHPSEVQLTARRGEYIMNEDAAKKFGPELDAMNAGRGVGGKFGMAGRMGAVMVASVAKGLMKKGRENMKARGAAEAMASGSGSFSTSGYTPGQGGWQRPAPPGFAWRNTHDYGTPEGQPIYALSDGVIADSRAITSGGSPGNGSTTPNGVPYRSYGETIGMRAADGSLFRYAHLSARYVGAGQKVAGGALIGRTGNTGNSSGPHLHMDVNGDYNASGYLASRGVALRKGAQYVKFDNTAANLHRGESVLTKRLTEKMHEGVDRFANGDDNDYNVIVNIYDARDPDAVARKVEQRLERKTRRRPQSRRVGNG